jgi:hypothetical protein
MKPTRRLLLASIAGTALIAAAPQAFSQQKDLKKQIVGDWMLVSTYNEREGQKREQFGSKPEGYMHLGPNGRFSYLVFAKDAPPFAAKDRAKATPEEAAAVVHNSIAYYGTYKINEKDGTLEWNIEHSTFPNNKGTGKRSVKFSGDQMTMTNTGATAGGTNVFVWKRAK